jgi:cytochrome c oxidase subunit 2
LQITAPTNRFSAGRTSLLAAAFALLLLALPSSASAAPLWPDAPQSPTASIAFKLFVLVFLVGAAALVGYTLSLRDARRRVVDPDSPAATDPSAKGAVLTGLAVFAVLVVAGGGTFIKSSSAQHSTATDADAAFFKVTTFKTPSLKVAHVVKAPKGPAYAIRVNAQQFLWRYEYPNAGAPWKTYSYGDLVLPAGITVMLDFTSSDAEAAWWVPQLGGSVSAMPGYSNKVWIRADKPGVYTGAGTVVNGTNYANMTTTVNVVPPALFALWVKGKQIEISDAMTALGVERAAGIEDKLLSGGSPDGQKGAK